MATICSPEGDSTGSWVAVADGAATVTVRTVLVDGSESDIRDPTIAAAPPTGMTNTPVRRATKPAFWRRDTADRVTTGASHTSPDASTTSDHTEPPLEARTRTAFTTPSRAAADSAARRTIADAGSSPSARSTR
ncbi:hypothetical protein EU513_13990 [Yimella sp. RIT 621]|uniref:hypothetical protein n=1 Tax=Yimella sp. RIT 621 TaxID=2510323 RepID=UPI00101B8D26|nr:hypothetical protein [Yimella sp. RIT 621]RYG76156.1 hypothetical protein EU513_13990 [Yimella sp. RIT 621]